MTVSPSKRLIHKIYQVLIRHTMSDYDDGNLRKSAIVFSPHPDDETLGCGGTILRKKQAGADIKIVFMTDGCLSHAHLIAPAELKAIRAQEAISAAQALGIEPEDVICLEFPDGGLQDQQAKAIQAVAEILLRYQPEEIYIPYYKEYPADHSATNHIVLAALNAYQLEATVYEYPIWFWRHFPITTLAASSRRETLSALKNSVLLGFGLRLRDFQCSVYVGDLLDQKQQALAQHRSQMQPLIPHSGWQTLADVAKGEFLECFFQDYEIFRRYRIAGKGSLHSQPLGMKVS